MKHISLISEGVFTKGKVYDILPNENPTEYGLEIFNFMTIDDTGNNHALSVKFINENFEVMEEN